MDASLGCLEMWAGMSMESEQVVESERPSFRNLLSSE